MREPPARVRFIGHPAVAMPIMGLCGLAIYLWVQNPSAVIVGIGAIIGLMWIARAQTTMNQYRRWQRAWDGMAEPAVARSSAPRMVAGLIAVLVVGGFALAESGGAAVPAGSGPALAGLAAVAVLAAVLWALIKRPRSPQAARRATDRRAPVRVAITRPVMPVPDLKTAYDALPAHCWQAIDATRK